MQLLHSIGILLTLAAVIQLTTYTAVLAFKPLPPLYNHPTTLPPSASTAVAQYPATSPPLASTAVAYSFHYIAAISISPMVQPFMLPPSASATVVQSSNYLATKLVNSLQPPTTIGEGAHILLQQTWMAQFSLQYLWIIFSGWLHQYYNQQQQHCCIGSTTS